MNRLMVLNFTALALTVTAFVTLVQPAAAEEYSSYDEIVRELRGSAATSTTYTPPADTLSAVKIHAAVALVSSRVNVSLPGNLPKSKGLRGFEAAFGIDLFSPRWIAEGAVRSFSPERYAETQMSLKEFDLRIMHRRPLTDTIFLRVGGGMAARYLDFEQSPAITEPGSYTTPASLFALGFGAQITPGISLGAEAHYRSPLINETADEGAVDGAFRFTGTF